MNVLNANRDDNMNIIIEPNYELFLNIILISWIIGSPFKILFGLMKKDKINYDVYDWGDIFNGVLRLVIIVFVLMWN
jgi:hypothetical protein